MQKYTCYHLLLFFLLSTCHVLFVYPVINQKSSVCCFMVNYVCSILVEQWPDSVTPCPVHHKIHIHVCVFIQK